MMARPSCRTFQIMERLRANISFALLMLAVASPASAIASTNDGPLPAGAPEPYVDKLIDGGNLTPITVSRDEDQSDRKGNVRSLILEVGGSVISPKSHITGVNTAVLDSLQREAGFSVSGRYQTDNFGLLNIDAQVHRGTEPGLLSRDRLSSSITIGSRDIPLGKGWLADAMLGMTTVPAIELARRQTRFYLPSTPIMGGSLTLRSFRRNSLDQTAKDPEPVTTFNLAIGEPGLLGGLRLSDFSGLSGLALSGGAQFNLTSKWAAGLQVAAVKDTIDPYAVILQSNVSKGPLPRTSSQAALATFAYSHDGIRVQANGIWSHRSGISSNSNLFGDDGVAGGSWIDASWRSGKTLHSAGLYYFSPKLSWGTSALINNAYGGYYRLSASSQRWRWTLNLDAVDTIEGGGSSGLIANADLRRKLDFRTTIGLNTTVRITSGLTTTQLLGFVDFSTKLGSSRLDAAWGHDPSTDLYRVGINQNWSLPTWLPAGSRLSTQVAFEHRHQKNALPSLPGSVLAGKANSFGAAISAGVSPFGGVSFDATIAYNSNGNSTTSGAFAPVEGVGGALGYLSSEKGRALSASIVATARLSSNWSLSASYTDTSSRLTSLYGLNDVNLSTLGVLQSAGAGLQRNSYHLRAGYLTLRYSASGGRPKGSLGLRQFPVGGTGNLEGRVYLDTNDNGTREPLEAGVRGIIVYLDGIQAVRTDQAGYYRFEGVSDGQHRISINADMLPLPWVIESSDKANAGQPFLATINVGVRSTTVLDIAARRD